MNEYYQAWLDHKEQFEMPPIKTSDANSEGPYWTIDRAHNVHAAGRQTRSAFTLAATIAQADGPLPFADVIAYTTASFYSAAWWMHALS